MSTLLTRAERNILREHRGTTLEARTIREKLHAHGRRYCRGCDRIKPLTSFGQQKRSYRHPSGYQSRCKPCSRAYWRQGNNLTAKAPYVAPPPEVAIQRQRRSVARCHIMRHGYSTLDVRLDIPMRKATEFYAPVHHSHGDVKPTRVERPASAP